MAFCCIDITQKYNNKERSKTMRNLTKPCINLSEYWTSIEKVGSPRLLSDRAPRLMWITTSPGNQRDVVDGVVMVVLKSDMKSWFEQMIVIRAIRHMTQFASVSRRRSFLPFFCGTSIRRGRGQLLGSYSTPNRLSTGEWLIKKPKNRLLQIFSPHFTLNSQIRLFYAEKWIFLKLVTCESQSQSLVLNTSMRLT